MPYVITTRREGPYWGPDNIISQSRRAVATLEEAQDAVIELLPDPDTGWSREALTITDTITESGGTVGPLPDGTVIEVAPMDWRTMVRESDIARRQPSYWFAMTNPTVEERTSIIDAYNARQGS